MEKQAYKILVKDNADSPIGIVFPIKGLRFSKRLNNYGEASFKIRVDDPRVSELFRFAVIILKFIEANIPILNIYYRKIVFLFFKRILIS